MESLEITQFIAKSKDFRAKLEAASNFDEMLSLWRNNSFAYNFNHPDPHSQEYRKAVEDLYRELASNDYSVQNELTSTKQSKEQFDIGFPWSTGNLDIISRELAKVCQAMQAIANKKPTNARIIEFGAGWGNLAIPLARSGQDVTVVDIDQGFIDRINRISKREGLTVKSLTGDFVDVSARNIGKFDVVLFQASFHHCLDFGQLLENITDRVLASGGVILFFSEPIYKDLPFPWGLRYDGESLWAIMCNKWLELGFNLEFFKALMIQRGLFLSSISPVSGFIGEGWAAQTSEDFIAFEDWEMPAINAETFHSSAGLKGYGRFCKDTSVLPGLLGCLFSKFEIEFKNFSAKNLSFSIFAAGEKMSLTLTPSESGIIEVDAACRAVTIKSQIYTPNEQFSNGDTRILGIAITRIRMTH